MARKETQPVLLTSWLLLEFNLRPRGVRAATVTGSKTPVINRQKIFISLLYPKGCLVPGMVGGLGICISAGG